MACRHFIGKHSAPRGFQLERKGVRLESRRVQIKKLVLKMHRRNNTCVSAPRREFSQTKREIHVARQTGETCEACFKENASFIPSLEIHGQTVGRAQCDVPGRKLNQRRSAAQATPWRRPVRHASKRAGIGGRLAVWAEHGMRHTLTSGLQRRHVIAKELLTLARRSWRSSAAQASCQPRSYQAAKTRARVAHT